MRCLRLLWRTLAGDESKHHRCMGQNNIMYDLVEVTIEGLLVRRPNSRGQARTAHLRPAMTFAFNLAALHAENEGGLATERREVGSALLMCSFFFATP